jgi:cellulase
MKLSATFSALLSVVSLSGVQAHTIFQQLYVNGVSPGHDVGIRYATTNNPITDVTSNDVICNNPTASASTIVTVPAGATITHEWHHGGNGADPNDGDDPIAKSHLGPVMVYLAKVDNAQTTGVTGLRWFKIAEDGLDSSGQWGVNRLLNNGGKATAVIPSCIPAGNYLLRAEIIALHSASTYPGAQLYMGCAQINVTGGGSASPATVSFPGAYKGSDPGITVNIYSGLSSYTIPGPRPFTCSGSTNPTTTAKPSSTSTTKPSSTTKTSTAPSSTSTGTVAKYGQCGGIGYTGPTTCVSGTTCTYSNDYYSQCL